MASQSSLTARLSRLVLIPINAIAMPNTTANAAANANATSTAGARVGSTHRSHRGHAPEGRDPAVDEVVPGGR